MSAAHAHRLPPRRTGFKLWFMRVLGLLATAALLGAGVYTLRQVLPKDDETAAEVQSAPIAHAKKKHTAKAKHAKPKAKYTRAQRRQRAAAVTALRNVGYRPVHLSDYDARKALRVMVGRGESGQRAFFFTGSAYLGNDATEDSARIRVTRAGNRSVALTYGIFKPGDKACCPSGRKRVLFRWNGQALAPRTSIPPVEQRRPPVG